MDGRPHPPEYAAHTWQGFSTGKWDGDMLTVTTTHLKMGWIRRNGIPRSDKAMLTEHFVRHGNYLTLISVINDPVYLTEPFVRTTNWGLDPHQQIAPYPCQCGRRDRARAGRRAASPAGLEHVPARVRRRRTSLPFEPTRGGAETMYPEYMLKLQKMTPATAAGRRSPRMQRNASKHGRAWRLSRRLARVFGLYGAARRSQQGGGGGRGGRRGAGGCAADAELHIAARAGQRLHAGRRRRQHRAAGRRRRRAAGGHGARGERREGGGRDPRR